MGCVQFRSSRNDMVVMKKSRWNIHALPQTNICLERSGLLRKCYQALDGPAQPKMTETIRNRTPGCKVPTSLGMTKPYDVTLGAYEIHCKQPVLRYYAVEFQNSLTFLPFKKKQKGKKQFQNSFSRMAGPWGLVLGITLSAKQLFAKQCSGTDSSKFKSHTKIMAIATECCACCLLTN